MIDHHLFIGAIGQGVFRSLDHGETFRRAADGMFVECDTRALVVDPRTGKQGPPSLFLGSEDGIFHSNDGAKSWHLLTPAEGKQVWSLTVLPTGRLVAGLCPGGILYSDETWRTWTVGRTTMQPDCPRIRHSRVTCVVADPHNPDHLWAGVEIDGIHESSDGGTTWTRVGEGLTSPDIHAIVKLSGGRMLATTNRDLNQSEDGGKTWQAVGLQQVLPWNYCRALVETLRTPGLLLLGGGDGPPGSEGMIALSTDEGRTWTPAYMPGRSNSTIWSFAQHPADPRLIYAISVSGQVFRSLDTGESWSKLPREFGEIRAVAWLPA